MTLAAFVVLALFAMPQDRDPRCNTAARYDAMRDGANCSASEAWPVKKSKRSRE